MRAGRNYDLAICYTGERSWFEQAFPEVCLLPQQGEELGARMANALHEFLQQGYQQAVLIGSDSPDLPLTRIEQAFAALDRAELVLVPASDGGYVLIGETQHHPQLFENIAWSTDQVLPETLRRVERDQLPTVQLDSWQDLDDLTSLQAFLQRSPHTRTAEHVRFHLEAHLSGENSDCPT